MYSYVLQTNVKEWLDKLFVSYGFRVSIIEYVEIARKYARDSVSGEYNNFLFVAEHLRFSDDQVSRYFEHPMSKMCATTIVQLFSIFRGRFMCLNYPSTLLV